MKADTVAKCPPQDGMGGCSDPACKVPGHETIYDFTVDDPATGRPYKAPKVVYRTVRDHGGLYPEVEARHEYVCFDLDGTLAEDTWPDPKLGAPIAEGVTMLKHYAHQGYCIIVYTARPASHASSIWAWVLENELGSLVYDVVCGKPLAGLYIDDRGHRFVR